MEGDREREAERETSLRNVSSLEVRLLEFVLIFLPFRPRGQKTQNSLLDGFLLLFFLLPHCFVNPRQPAPYHNTLMPSTASVQDVEARRLVRIGKERVENVSLLASPPALLRLALC